MTGRSEKAWGFGETYCLHHQGRRVPLVCLILLNSQVIHPYEEISHSLVLSGPSLEPLSVTVDIVPDGAPFMTDYNNCFGLFITSILGVKYE
jgi:hypothetical protein